MSAATLLTWMLTALFTVPPVLVAAELLRPALALPLLAAFAAWIAAHVLRPPGGTAERATAAARVASVGRARLGLAATLLGCVAWICFSGIGGLAVCRWDYEKHNFIFSQLLGHRLPIDVDGSGFLLHYAFAYYILPVRIAGLARALGLPVGLDAVLPVLYSVMAFLAVLLLAAQRRMPPFPLLLVLVFSGGFDLLGMLAFGVRLDWLPVGNPPMGVPWNLEWWGYPFAPLSLTGTLYWAPQHFFGALAGTALVLEAMRSRNPPAMRLLDLAVLCAAAAHWSPYVAVGLAAIAATVLLLTGRKVLRDLRREGVRGAINPQTAAALPFAAGLSAFTFVFFRAAAPLSAPRVLVGEQPGAWLATFLINYAPFLVVLAVLLGAGAGAGLGADLGVGRGIWRGFAVPPARRRALVLAFAGLLAASALLLTLSHGTYNDWAMRTTLAPWIALAALTASILFMPIGAAARIVILAALLVAGADSLSELAISVIGTPNCAPYGSYGLEDLGELAAQYRGRPDSLLYRGLARDH